MKRILLIDSSLNHHEQARQAIDSRFELIAITNIADAWKSLKASPCDLVLLEANLPDGDGFQFCTELKNNTGTAEIPVIFITEKSSIEDKAKGFMAGADDYVVKPFNPLELGFRIGARFK